MENKIFKIETFIPEEYVNELRKELNEAGALTIGGNYDNCMTTSRVIGYWRPLKGAQPFMGIENELCTAEEIKVEFCCKFEVMQKAVDVIKKVHPYEQPVINVLPLIDVR